MRFILFFVMCSTAFGADITNIRTSRNSGKQRVVVDINSDNEPAFYKRDSKNSITLTIEARMDQAKEEQFKKLLANTNYINSVSFINLSDEGEVIAEIRLSGKASNNIFALSNPSRLVIDLDKIE